MTLDDFSREVEQVRLLYVGLCDKSKEILRRALPHVEALQRENTHFSPRLMTLMHSRSAGRLPEADWAHLGAALNHLKRFDGVLGKWLSVLKNGTLVTDISREIAECREAIDLLRRSTDELEGVLARLQE